MIGSKVKSTEMALSFDDQDYGPLIKVGVVGKVLQISEHPAAYHVETDSGTFWYATRLIEFDQNSVLKRARHARKIGQSALTQ